jgi:anthraniloyl-CoA monooxygenase
MDPATWQRAGLEESNQAAQAPGQSDLFGLEYFERVFAMHLEGRRLLGNNSKWARFRTIRCATWHHGNLVLMGDAAHTAHFSVGSGTKMAMEDAIALAFAVGQHGADLPRVFEVYESERRQRVQGIQRAAVPSLRWYEQFRHYWSFPAEQFAFHFLTRSNYDYGQLKERDPAFVAQVEETLPNPATDLHSLVISPAEISELVEAGAPVPSAGARNTLNVGQAAGSTDISRAEMDRMRDAFAATAAEGAGAGYYNLLVELGRGQLLHRFLSPLTNTRTDDYGGTLENRLRYPLEIIDAVKAAWPGRLWASISATDWLPGGFTDDDAVVLGRSLKEHGVHLVVVRSGHATPASIPWYGRCFNAQFSDRLRNEAGCRVAVAGGILSRDDALNVLLAGRADLVLADRDLFAKETR